MDYIKNVVWTEYQAHQPFFNAWKNDKNLVRKGIMPTIYVTFLLPMRFWNHFPYPSALSALLTGIPLIVFYFFPGLYSQTHFVAYLALVYVPLFEAFFVGASYYWIPGGKQSLCNFFYGESNITLFLGNPMSKLRAIGAGIGTVAAGFVVDGLYCGYGVAKQWFTAYGNAETVKLGAEAAKTGATAVNEMVQERLKILESGGRKLTTEEVQSLFEECENKLKAAMPPQTTVSGNVDISSGKGAVSVSHNGSHNGSPVNFQGSASVDSGLEVARKMQQSHGQAGFGK